MRDIVFLTTSISPHQLPWCAELVKICDERELRYVYTGELKDERKRLGWDGVVKDCRLTVRHIDEPGCVDEIEAAEILIADFRDVSLFIRRANRSLLTVYVSERWFKPLLLPWPLSKLGMLRLLHPGYFWMALRFTRLLRRSVGFFYFPVGVHAARDMARLCGLMHGDLRCLFKAPRLEFERQPGGRILLAQRSRETYPPLEGGRDPWGSDQAERSECLEKQRGSKYCLDKMRMWGYFVEGSKVRGFESSKVNLQTFKPSNSQTLKVLWVGRLLKLKYVDTIIRAVAEISTRSTRQITQSPNHSIAQCSPCSTRLNISLDIYGTGPEEGRLKKMARGYEDVIRFYGPVPIAEVRKLMREHDVYVFASDAHDGWGAVVSEALEEGMKVIGTYEAGSSATMLPKERLFHAGDWRTLANLLEKEVGGGSPSCSIGNWTSARAAEALVSFLQGAVK